MVETIGTRRGITPTVGKGVKRRNIRYNADDSITNYSKGTKVYKKQYVDLNRARIEDISYYLGSDWIDWSCVKIGLDKGKVDGRYSVVTTKVFRCSKCDLVYQTGTIEYGKNIGNTYIDGEPFVRLPMNRGDCGLCG